MKTMIATTCAAALVVAMTAPAVLAGPISSACLQSDRAAKSRSLCGCIQQVADQALTRSEQRIAAGFFRDPHKAQEVRQSRSHSNEVFWKRYSEFGTIVAASCGHLG
ncbi:hypothetical protein SAMN04490248_101115 [Salinihabitans flavidus]|uniref:Uncharacterized protein n=1 Tax=Salinihabitans flavidus TaxID=569882 RepID=A0A1H8LEQ4_9RHOB|nr:hypothetical protein [Salinihabitans flavidus]SEO03682.1 hypothetical protein SAMN04490248_101115 [Salinihabitans flavidus]